MKWRDFFYFSKGERRALVVLLCLISAAWLALVLTDNPSSLSAVGSSTSKSILHPICIYPLDSISPAPTEEPTIAVINKKSISTPKASALSDKKPFYQTPARVEKYPVGTIVELNTADTIILKKVPGIGSAFSNRIIKYRNLLGGFYSVTQLAEVYGIDEDRYNSLRDWFCVNPKLIRKRHINHLPEDSISRHPYISYKQARVMKQLCRQKGKLEGWENLILLEEFTDYDRERISPYISFE